MFKSKDIRIHFFRVGSGPHCGPLYWQTLLLLRVVLRSCYALLTQLRLHVEIRLRFRTLNASNIIIEGVGIGTTLHLGIFLDVLVRLIFVLVVGIASVDNVVDVWVGLEGVFRDWSYAFMKIYVKFSWLRAFLAFFSIEIEVGVA